MAKKTAFVCFAILFLSIIASISFLSVSADTAYATELDYAFFKEDFSFEPDENIPSPHYANGESGAKIRLTLSETQANGIISIRYTLVRIKTEGDVVTFDEYDIFINNRAITSEQLIETKTAVSSEFHYYQNATWAKFAYIDITVKEWCAIVLDVTYDDGGGEKKTYESYVKKVTEIDNSPPTAYYRTWSYDEGAYTFSVVVNGNETKATRTANSGIQKIVIKKVTGLSPNETVTVIDTIENITSYPYYYTLRTDTGVQAFYYAEVTDWVNNKSEKLIVAIGSYDEGFESAVINKLNELERAGELFSPYLIKNMSDEFAKYCQRVQEFYEATEAQRVEIVAEINKQKNAIYTLLGDYARIRTLAENGVRDYEVKLINTEYMPGVTVGNVNTGYTALLWGEKATFTIALADFDLKKTDKSAEIAASGLIDVKRVMNLTLSTRNSVTGDVKTTFTSPIEIQLPAKDYKAVSAMVVNIDENGAKTFETLEVIEYKNYVGIQMPYSDGVITVVFGKKKISPFYWFFTLLVIPAGAGAYFVIKKLKKKKAEKLAEIARLRQEEKAKTNYVPKNKSKKKKKNKR